jgi:Mg2+-importing ATPase
LPFLPMLPKQILLINFFTDLPEMTIANDNVDDVFVRQPHRWDIGFIRRFMLIFGTLSSAFDYLTFGLLFWVLRAGQDLFHTGWFVESVLSASLVVFALRTRLPLHRSRPGRALLAVTGLMILVTVLLPYTPLAGPLGFKPLPPLYWLVIAAIVAAYIASAEVVKRWFYRHYGM